jgi:hypothetical protein
MKKRPVLFVISLCVNYLAFGQNTAVNMTGSSLKTGYLVKEISKTIWNTSDGIPYLKVAGANLGATSFEIMDKSRIAFLSDASSEIIIVDKSSGKAQSKFTLKATPRDFAFDKGFFYVLGENEVSVYTETGTFQSSISFRATFSGVGRITRYNNLTYLLLPSGNSVKLESSTASVPLPTYKGWITTSGNFVTTGLLAANSYSVGINSVGGKHFEKTLHTDKKVAGVYVVGATSDRVIVDLQTYVNESPICVERHLVSFALTATGIGEMISTTKVPDCYYVLSDKDFSVEADGTVYNMISAPDGLSLFSLTETELAKAQTYPVNLTSLRYHFNDHLENEQKN